MLAEFLHWWWQQLLELLPGHLRRLDPRRAHGLVIDPAGETDPPAIHVALRRKLRETPLGRFVLDEAGIRGLRKLVDQHKRIGPVVLRLSPALLLEQEVTLPLAAERDPAGVLGYEMNRITPFSPDEVFWTWQVRQRDRARGRLMVRLSLVPRRLVQDLMATLAASGAGPAEIELPSPSGLQRIALRQASSGRAALGRFATRSAIAICACLAITAIALPFIRQSVALTEVEGQIAALRPKVAEAEALRKQITGAEADRNVLAAESTRSGDVLRAIATITDILPDDTFLTEFTLHERKLTLGGQSAAAARLIPALSADPLIRNPAFVAPVTRAEGGRQADQFAIRAELAP